MTNSISVDSLSVISHSSIPVVTTELLSNLYGTDADNIKKNFARNAERFTEGKHFFKLTGDELRTFKHKVTDCPFVKVVGNVRHLMLWTERGAARHAKMLETDQAWEVFEKLEDCYFSKRPQADVDIRRDKPANISPQLNDVLVNVRRIHEHAELALDLWKKYVAPMKPPILVGGLLLDMCCTTEIVANDLESIG